MNGEERQVVIVGAGIAGLTAATELRRAGFDVVVLDKGRGPGGRMSVRRIGDARLDHGAQFFTVSDPRFAEMVAEWAVAGAAVPWPLGRESARPCYRGTEGMNSVPRHLARDLEVRTSTRVRRVKASDASYLLELEDGSAIRCDALLLTPPVPQTLALLDAGAVELPAAVRILLDSVAYDPCFAALVVLEGPSRILPPGGRKLAGDPIDWIADNRVKGVSPSVHAVTLHASADFTREHLDDSPARIGSLLVEAARDHLGSAVVEVQVHRWLFARAVVTTSERFLPVDAPAPMAFAGDAFGDGRVEGAALSGLEAAEWLRARIGSLPVRVGS